MSLDWVATSMGWDESKLSRIENATARMPPQDVAKLLGLYDVTDPTVVAALESLAKDAGKQGRWQTYGDVLALNYRDYLTLESDAESIHINAPLIPGLLQTGAEWHKSPFSNGPEQCVEIAELPGGCVAIRDSRNPQREPLRYTAEEWAAFRRGVIEGAL